MLAIGYFSRGHHAHQKAGATLGQDKMLSLQACLRRAEPMNAKATEVHTDDRNMWLRASGGEDESHRNWLLEMGSGLMENSGYHLSRLSQPKGFLMVGSCYSYCYYY